MSYKTLEVELENGRVSPVGPDTLPAKAHALLTILEPAPSHSHPPERSLGDALRELKVCCFVLSCYGEGVALVSVPLETSERRVQEVLGRGEYPINGEPLTKAEFLELRKDTVEGVEIGWRPGFEYFLEGRNYIREAFNPLQ